MCFFKTMRIPAVQQLSDAWNPKEIASDISEGISTENELFQIPEKKQPYSGYNGSYLMALNCLGLANMNSQIMMTLDHKLSQAEALLQAGKETVEQQTAVNQTPLKRSSEFLRNSPEKREEGLFESSNHLVKTLFGAQQYRYKLSLDGNFSETQYKDRNFNLNVRLVDVISGKQRNNGNIVNLCLGVADNNAEWIYETKEGLPFIKGKLEAELYHGTASFLKMALRDVTRIYSDKTVNIVVYPKPTVLRYSGESSIEENVDFSEIEPLVIEGVCVKAKKRD